MLARLIFFTLIHGILSAYPASLSVWSLGFCEYADVKPVEREFEGWMGFSDDRYLFDKHHYLREIKEGSIVWIKADWLYAFVAKVLPQLKHKIILVA